MAHEAGRFVLYSEPHCPLASRVIRHGPTGSPTDLEKGSLSRGEYLRDDRDSPLVPATRDAWHGALPD